VPGLDLEAEIEQIEGRLPYREAAPAFEEAHGLVMRQAIGSSGTCRLCVEFLEHLDRQGQIAGVDQFPGAPALRLFLRRPADGIEQDIRVEEGGQYFRS